MKNMFLGLAIACLTVACASEKKASVEDSSAPAAVECGKSACSEAEKAECASKKAKCSAEAKAECESKKVCPVTGKEIN